MPAPDLVKRNFVAAAPNKIWTADITYIHTSEDFLYLAFILDVYSRRVVGWSIATPLRPELVVDAPEMALWRRNPDVGLIHHTDRGVQLYGAFIGQETRRSGYRSVYGFG
jgi:putative transposase